MPWMEGGTVSWLAKVELSSMLGGAMDGTLDGAITMPWMLMVDDAVYGDDGWHDA